MNSRPLETEKSAAYEVGERWIMAAGPSSIVGWPIVSSPDGQSICNLSWIGKKPYHVTEEEFAAYRAKVEARGRLIAAAPDLLEALREMRDAAVYQSACQATDNEAVSKLADEKLVAALAKARAALTKATGSRGLGGQS